MIEFSSWPMVVFRARVCINNLPLKYANEAIHKLGQLKRYSESLAVGR